MAGKRASGAGAPKVTEGIGENEKSIARRTTAGLRFRIVMEKIDKRASFLRQMEQFQFPLLDGYKFDRDEANER
jgi:hypothetical protein